MPNNFKKLNFNCQPLNFDITYLMSNYTFDPNGVNSTKLKLDSINQEFNKILNDLGIEVKHIEVFIKPPNYIGNHIHIDGLPGDKTKIIWIYGGKNSVFNWYKPKEGVLEKYLPKEGLDKVRAVGHFAFDELELIESSVLEGPNLIQIGIPHDATNPEELRIAICFSLFHTGTMERITMSQGVNLFAKYF